MNDAVNVVTTDAAALRFREAGFWTAETLSGRVREHGLVHPDRVAVVDRQGRRSKTYAELNRDAAAVAGMLEQHAIGVGDVVSVQLPNWYEAVVVAVAVQSRGAVVNPLLPDYRTSELTHVFTTARPRAIFTPATYRGFDHRRLIEEVQAASGIRTLHVVVDDASQDASGGRLLLSRVLAGAIPGTPVAAASTPASAVSELIFTSGTEAEPKAIMHTEETANFAVRTAFADLGVAADQRVWMPSPVGHSTGFNYGVRAAMIHGRTLVLQDRWHASEAFELVAAHGCSYTLAAATFLQDLVEECERRGETLPGFTHFGCGGSPVPAQLVARADAVGICVLRLYGSTEVLCATWNRPTATFTKRANTDGPALTQTDISVRDDDGEPVSWPGEGELHVRGPNTSVGFFRDPERTMCTYLAEGWVASGDLARIDEDGYVTIVGRKKEIIIRGGMNIAPREIEDLLAAFPEVERGAVVGVPDDRLGERMCACVVLRPHESLNLSTVVARLRATGLATYKLPQRLEIVTELPATASGKIKKHELLRQLGREAQKS